MKRSKICAFLVLIVLLFTQQIWAKTPEEIMNQVDEYRHLKFAKVEATMVIIKGERKMKNEMISWISGSEKSLSKFTNPRDRGTKFLKRNDDLWMFFPDAEDVVKISGHMLEQGMMGSDYSYQDMMESTKLTDLYNFEIIDEKKYNGRYCYVMEGIKKEGAEASYYRRKSWIDKERSVLLKEELYAQSGRLLKVMETKEVEKIDGRWFATYSVMDDKLRKRTYTEFKIDSIAFNVDIPAGIFSLQRLRN
jgi:outer membrane lipoprotein-sorting protein